MSRIAVIGGGIVGLAAAYALKQTDERAELTIIEKKAMGGAPNWP